MPKSTPPTCKTDNANLLHKFVVFCVADSMGRLRFGTFAKAPPHTSRSVRRFRFGTFGMALSVRRCRFVFGDFFKKKLTLLGFQDTGPVSRNLGQRMLRISGYGPCILKSGAINPWDFRIRAPYPEIWGHKSLGFQDTGPVS